MVVTTRAALASPARRPSVQDEALEGLELVAFGCRLALKNSIVIDVLRDRERFDRECLADRARSLFDEVANQSQQSADRMVEERDSAQTRAGRGRHQHDYRALDVGNLERREAVYRALTAWIRDVIGDDDEMRQVVELARLDAWGEVAGLIERRLDGWTAPPGITDEPLGARRARAVDAVGVALQELRAEQHARASRRRGSMTELERSGRDGRLPQGASESSTRRTRPGRGLLGGIVRMLRRPRDGGGR